MVDFLRKDMLNFISGLAFLFIISIFENIRHVFLAPQLSDFTTSNDLFRNILFIILIFITLEVSGLIVSNNRIENKIVLTLVLYLFVLLFSKQNLYFSLFELVIFFSMYCVYYYLINDGDDEIDKVNVTGNDKYYIALYVLTGVLLFSSIIGFMFYYLKQKQEKGNKFTLFKFLFRAREKFYYK